MLSYFWMSFEAIGPASSSSKAIAFDLRIHQNTRRVARLCSQEFELWLVDDRSRNIGKLLSRLLPDVRSDVTDSQVQPIVEFRDNQQSPCRLLWHYTPEQLQQVEDTRQGGKPLFLIHARFAVTSIWPQPNENSPRVTHEIECPGHQGGWPMRIEMPESEWISLLAAIGFRHPVMDRISWPALPPRFSRAEGHLNSAWGYYRQKDPAAALSSCYKAFECLGFDLFGKEVERKEVIDLLLGGISVEKQQAVVSILRSLQSYFQLGRHDKRAPVDLTYEDAQMAVICATTLLAYLAPQAAP